MDAKKIALLKVAVFVIILLLIGLLIRTYSKIFKIEEVPEIGAIRNNETTLLAYGDEKFLFSSDINDKGNPEFSFVKKNDKNNTTEVIEEYNNLYIDSEIFAQDNMLFYCVCGDTYIYDIPSKNISLFGEGKLQDLTENWYVSLDQGVLYKGIYYPNTMKTRVRYPITENGDIKFAYEDEERLYYIAASDKNYYGLLGLNKSDLTITIYDSVFGYEEKILEVMSNEDYIFEIIEYVKDEMIYGLRIIPKDDKDNSWEIKLDRKTDINSTDKYTYDLLDRKFIDEPKKFDKNIYMLRFKVNETGETLQDGYMIHNIDSMETELAKPSLTDICIYEYFAEIKGAQLVIYKQNKEYKRVTLSGQKEGEVEIREIYKIDEDIYFKIRLDPVMEQSTYVRVNKDGTAEIYE